MMPSESLVISDAAERRSGEQVAPFHPRLFRYAAIWMRLLTKYTRDSIFERNTDAERLLALTRWHWGIENCLALSADVIFKEDARRLKSLRMAEALAVFNNPDDRLDSPSPMAQRHRRAAFLRSTSVAGFAANLASA